MSLKIFKVADVRDWLSQHHQEKISFSRMVELMNEHVLKSMPTPIKCCKTGEYLHIGDMVKGSQGQYGYLFFEDYLNQFVIRSESGGNHKTSTFEKVHKLEKNVSNNGTECRPNSRVNRKKW